MPDLQKVGDTKNRILSIIKNKGPSYPAQVSKEAGVSPLFTAAFLSELVKDRQLKMSSMKVGSSPIYYAPGQEPQLENFVKYLNSKEREAFEKLKNSEVVEDLSQQPAIRVALRNINDFAVPINVRIDGETKLFWRHFQFPESQTRDRIRELLSPSNIIRPKQKETVLVQVKEEPKKEETIPTQTETAIKETKSQIEPLIKETERKVEKIIEKPIKIKSKKEKIISSEFAESVKDYLATKDVEILEEVMVKKKEFVAKVRTDESFGKQEFYLIAKDKKKINQDDLTLAIQHAQSQRMPALFLSPGSLDANASSYIQEWKNVIKFNKVKI
ncbi:hypothetical protein AUJ84_02285 [Candidatus Pacearchaeota archaeon CG1_02_32_132]|nr:MAG: hypothetical protein AUJ84_02285 [Candidatus Pacearchaeota archaeon CG1_02_32_132]